MNAVMGSQSNALHGGGLNWVDPAVSCGKHTQPLRITNSVQLEVLQHPQDRISEAMDTFNPAMFRYTKQCLTPFDTNTRTALSQKNT